MLRYAVATLAVGVGVTTFFLVTDAKPRRFERPRPPAPVGVFAEGGAPARDEAIEHVLDQQLPAVMHQSFSYLGHDGHADIHALWAAPAFAKHGPDLQRAWCEYVDALGAWMTEGAGEQHYKVATDELRAHAEVVSDQLAAAGLAYMLDASALRAVKPDIVPYRIERVSFVFANAERQRVLELRDLVKLPGTQLGRTNDELGDPVVLLDAIDEKLANIVQPVLAGSPFPLGVRGASQAAGDAVRRELGAVPSRARELLVASIRHHEAQHGLDAERKLPFPAALAKLTSSERAKLELSAYVSQIASDMWTPQLTLWSLARHAFNRAHNDEAQVAIVVMEGLARQLKIPMLGDHASLVAPLAAKSTIELRNAAAALWAELFEDKLVRIVD